MEAKTCEDGENREGAFPFGPKGKAGDLEDHFRQNHVGSAAFGAEFLYDLLCDDASGRKNPHLSGECNGAEWDHAGVGDQHPGKSRH